MLWQLADSAFPTGAFAHSGGLEAACQHGEVRNGAEFAEFARASLDQLGHATLPFVTAAHEAPDRFAEFDRLCDAFTSNHVANRASRLQGCAFLSAVQRIFRPPQGHPPEPDQTPFVERRETNETDSHVGNAAVAVGHTLWRPEWGHFAPVFGAATRYLDIPRDTVVQLFCFLHLRGLMAAAVRLNIVGPMEAQRLQHRMASCAEETIQRCESLTLDDVGQTAPLLDLWQGAQDRLYSRLFQS